MYSKLREKISQQYPTVVRVELDWIHVVTQFVERKKETEVEYDSFEEVVKKKTLEPTKQEEEIDDFWD